MRPTPRTAPTGAGELSVAAAPLDHWHEIVDWTADEGWNPGDGDINTFHPTDPDGFHLGRLGDRTVSAVSLVNYSPAYAFLGFYLVAPGLRGQGLGLATWRTALPHAGSRTIGLDAVPAQQETYQRAGFTPAHDTLRYTGRPTPGAPTSPDTHPVTAAHLDAIAAYDRRCFPADRRGFVTRWLTAPGRTAVVHLRTARSPGTACSAPRTAATASARSSPTPRRPPKPSSTPSPPTSIRPTRSPSTSPNPTQQHGRWQPPAA